MKKTIRDIDLNNKKVLMRCDFNVPIEKGIIADDSKIVAAIDSIKYLLDQNCKIILMSHLGKIKEEKDKKQNSLYVVSKRLGELLKKDILFSSETRGPALETLVSNLKQKDILLMENTRYEDIPNKLESNCDMELSKYWASLADVFVNDAFGTIHRCHASNYGVSNFLPSVIGFLVEKELNALDLLVNNPDQPFTVIMGGAKLEDKIALIESIVKKCDYLLLTGGIANTFLKALNFNIGMSLCHDDSLPLVKKIMLDNKDKIMLPLDACVGKKYNSNYAELRLIDKIQDDDVIYDIGPKTIQKYSEVVNKSKTIFVNGTMGLAEDPKFVNGTRETLNMLTKTVAKVIVGGGDSVSAVYKFGFADKLFYLSTGGGATLEYLTNPVLKSIENIEEV